MNPKLYTFIPVTAALVLQLLFPYFKNIYCLEFWITPPFYFCIMVFIATYVLFGILLWKSREINNDESQNFSANQLFDIQKRIQSEGDSMQFYLDIFSADEFLEFKSIDITLESGDVVKIKNDNGDPFTFSLNQKDPTVETKETINEEL